MRKKWTFDEWFTEQFGKEPSPNKGLTELYDEEDYLKRKLAFIQDLIRRQERLVNYRNAAFLAWYLKDGDKK